MAEDIGFEPTRLLHPVVFKTTSFQSGIFHNLNSTQYHSADEWLTPPVVNSGSQPGESQPLVINPPGDQSRIEHCLVVLYYCVLILAGEVRIELTSEGLESSVLAVVLFPYMMGRVNHKNPSPTGASPDTRHTVQAHGLSLGLASSSNSHR